MRSPVLAAKLLLIYPESHGQAIKQRSFQAVVINVEKETVRSLSVKLACQRSSATIRP